MLPSDASPGAPAASRSARSFAFSAKAARSHWRRCTFTTPLAPPPPAAAPPPPDDEDDEEDEEDEEEEDDDDDIVDEAEAALGKKACLFARLFDCVDGGFRRLVSLFLFSSASIHDRLIARPR